MLLVDLTRQCMLNGSIVLYYLVVSSSNDESSWSRVTSQLCSAVPTPTSQLTSWLNLWLKRQNEWQQRWLPLFTLMCTTSILQKCNAQLHHYSQMLVCQCNTQCMQTWRHLIIMVLGLQTFYTVDTYNDICSIITILSLSICMITLLHTWIKLAAAYDTRTHNTDWSYQIWI
jgi:hypothetical protein